MNSKCNIFLIFYLCKPCTYICTANVCSWLVWTPTFWIACIAKQQETHPPHHPNDHGRPFWTNATINQRQNGSVNSIILLLVDYIFFSFVDCQLAAQIADFIQSGPQHGQANNTNGYLGTKMAQSCQKTLWALG